MNNIEKYGLTERHKNEAAQYPELQLGRVTAQYRGKYKVATEEQEQLAEISGKMRYETNQTDMYPTVGDYVMLASDGADSTAIIHRVLSRKSIFVRKAVGVSGQVQPVAANIDTVFICMSLNQNYNLNRLERYLSAAWDSGASPVVVLTKADLCTDLQAAIDEVQRNSFYCDVIVVSMYDEDIAEKFAPYLTAGKTAAFMGSSGVGKSTIINNIVPEKALATQEIGRGDKGRHTTTGRELFTTPYGGVVIDTPGMREFGVESADLDTTFSDIEELAKSCRYSDCTHTNEPGCAVVAAVNSGTLDQRRLDSFIKIRTEVGYDGLNSKEIEAKKLERMFKDVGGIKNARKIAKGKNKGR